MSADLVLLFVYLLTALVFSFLCSIAEAVLLKVTPSYVASLRERAPKTYALLTRLVGAIDRPLAGILSLNTVAHTVGAAGVGAQTVAVWGDQWVGLASAVLTFLVLVFSEIIPKTLGAMYWRSLAAPVAVFVSMLIWVLYPLVVLSRLLTKLLAGGRRVAAVTRDELAALADLGQKEGQLRASEFRILKNLFRFHSLKVADIMTPRTVVISFPAGMTAREAVERNPDLPVSRIPIHEGRVDDVVGFVLRTDLMLATLEGRGETPLRELGRHLPVVPESAPLSALFERLLQERVHIAAAVDEYGGLAGVVTLEDLVETLLGLEIVDEADKAVDMQKLAREHWQRRTKSIQLRSEEADRR